MGFEKRLRGIREKKNLSQREVAERLGISLSSYARWESGHGAPGPEGISKLADIFAMSADFLLGRQEIRQIFFTEKEGAGYSAVLNEADSVFLSRFRNFSPQGRDRLLLYMEDLEKIAEYKKN